ncbi:pirin family protein [Nocardioides sp.]|uniref:pirin family protein n=1 Tax=Nocardioides sp. TaxID=35761 RepID=UPI003D0F4A3B
MSSPVIRRAGDRYRSDAEGRSTYHSFSFGPSYDPANISFGGLVAHNDERIEPGHGYPDHPHRDLEIVTWVLSGALTHRDASGATQVITPGQVQRMSAGTGIVHSETVEPDAGATRFIQTWVRPSNAGGVPSYSAATARPKTDELTALASGVRPHALVRIGAAASLYVARLEQGVTLPDAQLLHVFVASGSIKLGDDVLDDGDAARLTDLGSMPIAVSGDAPAEVLVWAFRESGRRG